MAALAAAMTAVAVTGTAAEERRESSGQAKGRRGGEYGFAVRAHCRIPHPDPRTRSGDPVRGSPSLLRSDAGGVEAGQNGAPDEGTGRAADADFRFRDAL